MTIQEKCRQLNTDVHDRIFQTNHFDSRFGDYEKCFTSLDLIEDCQDAIDEFISIPESSYPRRSVLNIYGVLQAIYCQQDGLFGLYQNISRTKFRNLKDFFESFEFNKDIREIRNDIVGHPSSRKRDSEFYFIDKGPNSKFKFSYAGYTPEFRIVNVDLKKILTDQLEFTNKVLTSIDNLIKTTVQHHKEKHQHKSLYSIISNLNYSIQLIKRGYSDSHRSSQAEGGIKIVRQKISEFLDELKKRYNNEIPESIEDTNNSIQYILDKMQEWFDSGKLLNNMDGRIFMIAFDSEFRDLIQMSKEIDFEYSTNNA